MRRDAFAFVLAIAAIAAISPGCGEIVTLGQTCQAACASPTRRLVCDDDGSAHEEECAAPVEPCQAASCNAGQCSIKYAMGLSCGDDGKGVCREEGACLGPNMQIAATLEQTCAILHDGRVWCWGDNSTYQLGDGTTTYRDRPVPVKLPTDAAGHPRKAFMSPNALGDATGAIGTGYGHACVILDDDRSVWCWGDNEAGQCGTVAGSPNAFPEQVGNLNGKRFQSLALGQGQTCAISEDHEVYCWGYNKFGQCGVDPTKGNCGTGQDCEIVLPGDPIAALNGALLIVAEKDNGCALLSSGAMVCWGANETGQLTLPTTTPYSYTPVPIVIGDPKSPKAVKALGIGFQSTYAVTTDGLLYAWGDNAKGQLGLGVSPPVSPVPTPTLVVAMSNIMNTPLQVTDVYRSDGSDQCARVGDADAEGAEYACWGHDDYGELGFGMASEQGQEFNGAEPSYAIPKHSAFISHGCDFACSVVVNDPDYSIWCWGRAQYIGQSIAANAETTKPAAQFTALPVWTPIPTN